MKLIAAMRREDKWSLLRQGNNFYVPENHILSWNTLSDDAAGSLGLRLVQQKEGGWDDFDIQWYTNAKRSLTEKVLSTRTKQTRLNKLGDMPI